MGVYSSFLRPLLFRFDPEFVHNVAITMLSTGIVGSWKYDHPMLEQEYFGVKFKNPLGLAAGFDKNGVALGHWHHVGFGFVEIGTITYHGQPGNPKPRLFRLPSDLGIINRMGFNNEGAEKVAKRITGVLSPIPVGVNLGKSKITELADAPRDYQKSFRLLREHGRYFVINVSSPNTPGLRTLQEKGPLLEIIGAMREVDSNKPILVKVAPDLEFSALDDVIEVAHETGLAGLIATNTTIMREGLVNDIGESGGLSGMPLRKRSNEMLSYLHGACDPGLVLIGVGGIFNGRDLFEKISLGAHLAQTYTGWVYGGLDMVPRTLKQFVGLMRQRGIRSLAELRGSGVKPD